LRKKKKFINYNGWETEMINIENQKIQEVIQGIHEAIAARGVKVNENIVAENRLFSCICHDFDLEPTKCANRMNEKYGYEFSGDEIIQIFRSRRMANPVERRELFQWADEITNYFAGAIGGNRKSFDSYEKKRKEAALKSRRRHPSQERIAALMIYEKYPEIDQFDDTESLYLLGNTMAKYFFYSISDAIAEVYGFSQNKDNKEKGGNEKAEKKMPYDKAVKRVEQLERILDRTNTMLQELQDEFEEQLEASKVKELTDFFVRLNSERYGCILDELLVVRRGVDELRKSDYELPIEINGLLIMVKRLIQFVRDSHIEPVMKINSVREVTASDVEFCNYEGSPFITPKEKKKVRVISPGWIYKDKQLQISRPKVKEERL